MCLCVYVCVCVCVFAIACFLNVCYPVHVCINLCVVKIHSTIQRSRPFLYAIPLFVDRCMGNTPSKTCKQRAVKVLASETKQRMELPHNEFEVPTKVVNTIHLREGGLNITIMVIHPSTHQ